MHQFTTITALKAAAAENNTVTRDLHYTVSEIIDYGHDTLLRRMSEALVGTDILSNYLSYMAIGFSAYTEILTFQVVADVTNLLAWAEDWDTDELG